MVIEHTFNASPRRDLVKPLAVYFAGKVKPVEDYRAILFNDGRVMATDTGTELDIFLSPSSKWPFGTVVYAGPSALSCDHGCWHLSDHAIVNDDLPNQDLRSCDGGPIHVGHESAHIFRQEDSCPNGDNGLSRSQAVERCLYQIRKSDALYAYIDEPDCYGTLSEIGYAYALGIPIYIVFDDKLKHARDEYSCDGRHGRFQAERNDFWFIAEMATACAWGKPSELIDRISFSKRISKFSKTKRIQIRPKDRVAVLVRDQYTCRMCGASRKEGAVLEIDHIHPVSKGGTNALYNLQVLCRGCNAGKSNQFLPMP